MLLVISYEDFSYRAIRIIFFPLLCGALIVKKLVTGSWTIFFTELTFNLIYLSVLFFLSFMYLRLKYKAQLAHALSYIGMGDILFLLSLACWFEPISFFVFVVGSLIFSLIFHFIFLYCSKSYQQKLTVPLAGFQSICFVVFYSTSVILS